MKLLKDDALNQILSQYDLDIDHWLLVDNASYLGEASHKKAVLYAMQQYDCAVDAGKMRGKAIPASELFSEPPIPYKQTKNGVRAFIDPELHNRSMGENLKYWYAFLEPPYHNKYDINDFRVFNAALFPQGTDGLEIFSWNTEWSDFFDAGHEWWGAACWSIHDRLANRYVVILASSTD